jgi:hypothetical protein
LLHLLNTSGEVVMIREMHPEYFETHFDSAGYDGPWPRQFAIITGYATTGEKWTLEANARADLELHAELVRRGVWMQRVTGFSPRTGHAEPGWAAELSFSDACDLGHHFRQDALYSIREDQLFVSHCDSRRAEILVGLFRERLRY